MPAQLSQTARKLGINTLQELDRGKIALAVNHALRQCTYDVEDRPADKSKRVVILKIELSPELHKETAALDTINIEATVDTKLPVRRSSIYPMLPLKDGMLAFEPASPYDPRQASLFAPPPATSQTDESINPETGEVIPDTNSNP